MQPTPPTDHHDRPTTPSRKLDNDVLFKGVICALIGAIILLAPYVSRSPGVQDLMRQAYIVGWFALVLGIAFLVQYAVRRNKRRVLDAETANYLEQNARQRKSSRRNK
ncbi:DUF308 domain-containing protein [Diaphorobacter aerolatus]|uniref:DUF308 domain-containing protein n=1 Tax=Diaphorobacter aerolatus TaxID=1288495 RepID=UPI001D00ECF9|nr:DUF308 domain-containing protein [Diaphorobacter aerolatus]